MNSQTNQLSDKHAWDYIQTRWNAQADVVSRTLNRIINYIFTLNAGGLLASLTYIASREATGKIYFSIISFALGVFLITVHAAWSYYTNFINFNEFKRSVENYQEGKISSSDLIGKQQFNRAGELFVHILGWLSGLLFFLGLVVGICGI